MIDDGLIQHDSDVMVEEEREVDMETGAPASPTAPTPPEESPMQQGSEARDIAQDDQLCQISKESTDQNPPHNSDLNEELLGPVNDVSVPGGIQMIPSLLSFPQRKITCRQALARQDKCMG